MTQRDEALRLANEIRIQRANVRRELRAIRDPLSSRKRTAEIVEEHHDAIGGMPVGRLLEACHRLGATRLAVIYRHASVNPGTAIDRLTKRQKAVLCAELRAEHLSQTRVERANGGNVFA